MIDGENVIAAELPVNIYTKLILQTALRQELSFEPSLDPLSLRITGLVL